ncbi:hypothetical protein DL765_009052 [Monosporascus sp. GIB2]|nr:hypothetical protein DL765_009052 [Monosporascus sp. GIB2]
MDLVSSIRKSGSRGGVNFKWEDVAASNHRENYLGHSLKAPVGRWAKGKDLTWYAKADENAGSSTETAEEKAARERQEEIRKIKEMEEEALARALGLPVAPKKATGANSVDVGQGRGLTGGESATTAKGGDGKRESDRRKSRHHDDSERHHRKRHRNRSRSRDRRRDRSPRGRDEGHAHRSRGERDDQRRPGGYRDDEDDGERRRMRHRRERSRSRSLDRHDSRKDHRERRRPRSRDRQRSRSPQHRRQRSTSRERH